MRDLQRQDQVRHDVDEGPGTGGGVHRHWAHYARILKDGERWHLRKGHDASKDQSYFLFGLNQEQLAHALMPVGELSKAETRAIARELGLKTHDKVESQENYFVPEKDYGRFLRDAAKLPDKKGEIVTGDGKVLGHHDGVQYFTFGHGVGALTVRGSYATQAALAQSADQLFLRVFLVFLILVGDGMAKTLRMVFLLSSRMKLAWSPISADVSTSSS